MGNANIQKVTNTIAKTVDSKEVFLEKLEESGYSISNVAGELADMLDKDKKARKEAKRRVNEDEKVTGDVELDILKRSDKLKILKTIIRVAGVSRSISTKLSLNQFQNQPGGTVNIGKDGKADLAEALNRASGGAGESE